MNAWLFAFLVLVVVGAGSTVWLVLKRRPVHAPPPIDLAGAEDRADAAERKSESAALEDAATAAAATTAAVVTAKHETHSEIDAQVETVTRFLDEE